MNVIGPFPLYAILNPIYSQILHVRSIWNSFKIFTVSLSAEEFANGTFNLSYPNFRLCRSNRSASHEILIYSPTISHDLHFSVRGWHMSSEWEGLGARSSKFFGRTVFTMAINIPLPFLTSFTPLDLSPARASQTLAPRLLHRRQWGRASLPRPRRRRTHAGRGSLHSTAAIAVFLRQGRAWKICTDELHFSTSQFVVFFVQGN